jgi:hypothetical protein
MRRALPPAINLHTSSSRPAAAQENRDLEADIGTARANDL